MCELNFQNLNNLYIVKKLTINQIANKLNYSYNYIRDYLIKFKIPIRNISNAMKGKNLGNYRPDLSLRNKNRNMKGRNNPNYKDGRSLKKYCCITCRKEISQFSGIYGNKRCSSCCRSGKLSPIFGKKGILAPSYIHGKAYEPYPLGWNKTFKEQIRYRDGYKCQNPECGIPEIECYRKLDIHHINYDKKNINSENLISLCHKCHTKTNGYRNYYYAYFKYIMENK